MNTRTRCIECLKWNPFNNGTDRGRCGKTGADTYGNHDLCMVSEPKSWPDEATREAAERPRVGDEYANDDLASNHRFVITDVNDTDLRFSYSIIAGKPNVHTGRHSRKNWLKYLSANPSSRLLSRGPEPKEPEKPEKPEKPTLRDGDVLEMKYNRCWYVYRTLTSPILIDAFCGKNTIADDITREDRLMFNILDLAEHVKSGGSILLVKADEVGVALTKEESNHLPGLLWDSCKVCKSILGKLRAAMEGKKC